jgi:hypothetical protein
LLKGRIEEDPDRILKNTVANNPQNSVSHLQMRINSEIFTCVSQLPKTHPDSIIPQNDALSALSHLGRDKPNENEMVIARLI